MKRKVGRPRKYSDRQIRYFASMSKSKKKFNKWANRLYRSRIRKAKTKATKRAIKTILKKTKQRGFISRQNWKVATSYDIGRLVLEGKVIQNKSGTILLVEDTDNKIIAYEGDTLYNEAMSEREALLQVGYKIGK